MNPVKQILRTEGARGFLCRLTAAYIRLVWRTSRWRTVGGAVPAAYWDTDRPFILAFWHGRLLMLPLCWPQGRTMHILISNHRDGELIARTIGAFGLSAIRGSAAKPGKQDKGGAGAMRAMIKSLARGDYIGISPDGPRGPRMHASDGVVSLARLSGVPVIPVAAASSRRKLAGSWDRFMICLPFSSGVFVWGDPIQVPRKADAAAVARARLQIEEGLNAVSAEADRLTGHPPVEPAAAPAIVAPVGS